ncbi:MAG: barstar family protein, partial [Planctomycetota bacterium]|nr:barstar family protein [Planctomycetota bacterium]
MSNRVVQRHVLRNQITIPIHIRIDGDLIVDWESFHAHFAEVLGFPKFYGRNMD